MATLESSVIANAQPGNIIQLSYSSGDKYDRTHSMIVTKKTSSDIYLTYHSGPNNLDIVTNLFQVLILMEEIFGLFLLNNTI